MGFEHIIFEEWVLVLPCEVQSILAPKYPRYIFICWESSHTPLDGSLNRTVRVQHHLGSGIDLHLGFPGDASRM